MSKMMTFTKDTTWETDRLLSSQVISLSAGPEISISVQCSQQPATGPYLEPDESSLHYYARFLQEWK
jgi:hypothetical protein